MKTFYLVLISIFLNSGLSVAASPTDTVRVAFETGNYSAAVKAATTAIAEGQQDPSLHYWVLRSYYELHDYEKAIVYGEQAVKLDPANAEYNRWLGRAYGERAEQNHSFFLARKVKQAFESAVHLAPASIQARRDLMEFFSQAPWIVGGDRQKAREQIEAISRIDPAAGHLARGSFFKIDKKWKEAESEYAAVLETPSSRVESYFEAAEFFEERKDAPRIERAVEVASRIDAKDPRLSYYNAVSLILKGNELPTAERLLRSYVANIPERSDYPSHKAAQDWLSRIGH